MAEIELRSTKVCDGRRLSAEMRTKFELQRYAHHDDNEVVYARVQRQSNAQYVEHI